MKTLRMYRESVGKTQKALADQVGISNLTICNIENQISEPTGETRNKIEHEAHMRIDWLRTMGLKKMPKIAWEDAEKDLRDALLQANGLNASELNQFMQVAKEYINSFEEMVKANNILNSEVLLSNMDLYRRMKDIQEGRG